LKSHLLVLVVQSNDLSINGNLTGNAQSAL